MTGGDQQESVSAGAREHPPKPQDAVPRPDGTPAPPPRSPAQHEPLWFGWQRHRPQELGDVTVRWEWDEPEPSAPRANARRPPLRRRAVALGVLAAIGGVIALALPNRGFSDYGEVPSYWDDVTMTCRTARVENGDRALELFRCHAVDGGRLPPGVYRSPDTRWTSDITRREARATEIEISPDGELEGWAAY